MIDEIERLISEYEEQSRHSLENGDVGAARAYDRVVADLREILPR